MASPSTPSVNEIISFGRPNGQKTRAKVIRINRKTVTVEILEPRGNRPVHTRWRVDPALITKLDGKDAPRHKAPTAGALIGVGSRVEFNNGGTTIVGTVKRVNTKTFSIDEDGDTSGRYWRVSKANVRLTGAPAPKVDEAAIKAAKARKAAKAERDFKRWAASYGLKPEWFGETFTSRGTGFRIVGINTRAPKYPVQAERVRDGKGFKFTADGVRTAMIR